MNKIYELSKKSMERRLLTKQIVEKLLTSGQKLTKFAKKEGIKPNDLSRWKNRYLKGKENPGIQDTVLKINTLNQKIYNHNFGLNSVSF